MEIKLTHEIKIMLNIFEDNKINDCLFKIEKQNFVNFYSKTIKSIDSIVFNIYKNEEIKSFEDDRSQISCQIFEGE